MMSVRRCATVIFCFLASISVTTMAWKVGPDEIVSCYSDNECTGAPVIMTQGACCNNLVSPLGFSYQTVDGCQRCRIVLGFSQSQFIGAERGEAYILKAGYLQGRPERPGSLSFNVELGSASHADISTGQPRLRVLPEEPLARLPLTLTPDGVAQEFNETFSISFTNLPLSNTGLFPTPPMIVGGLNGTIIDGDRVTFGLSEDDYRRYERPDSRIDAFIVKDATFLANPVVFRVTPMTINDALIQGVLTHFNAPSDDSVSPSRASEDDFNSTSFEVTFPADEDEAVTQLFVARLEVLDAVNFDLITTSRTVSMCRIIDDDDVRIGFAQRVYSVAEPTTGQQLVRSVELVREGGRLSEQTFAVNVTVGAPASNLNAASNSGPDSDYSIGSSSASVTLEFPPAAERVVFAFSVNSDEMAEGVEAFQATTSGVQGFTQFRPPQTNAAFQSTEIRITEN